MGKHHSEYYSEVEKFETQVTHVTEQVLHEQDRLRNSTLREFNQTVLQLVADYEMFELEGQCDPSKMTFYVEQLEIWTNSLKQLHLELESVDNFLRYVIPNDQSLSTLTNFDEDKITSLQDEVCELRDVNIVQQDKEIESLKQQIIEKSNENLSINEKVKETCLDVSQDIDQCWKLLEQIEDYERRTPSREFDASKDPTFSTYNQWKWNQLAESELKSLEEQLSTLEVTKEKLGSLLAKRATLNPSSDLMEMFTTYQLLNELWEKKIISTLFPDIKNLAIYPQSGKIHFSVGVVEVIIVMEKDVINSVSLFSYELPYNQIESIKEGILYKIENQKSLFNVLITVSDHIINSL